MIKVSTHTNRYKTKDKIRNQSTSPRDNSFSTSFLNRLNRSTKKYSKLALRSILLSKAFNTSVKITIFGMILSTALYGTYALIGNTISKDVIVSKSEIINRVAKLITLPKVAPDAVVRVQDPEALKKQNSFYEGIKEGDYIIVYPSLAVIYDLRNNIIIGLKHSR